MFRLPELPRSSVAITGGLGQDASDVVFHKRTLDPQGEHAP